MIYKGKIYRRLKVGESYRTSLDYSIIVKPNLKQYPDMPTEGYPTYCAIDGVVNESNGLEFYALVYERKVKA